MRYSERSSSQAELRLWKRSLSCGATFGRVSSSWDEHVTGTLSGFETCDRVVEVLLAELRASRVRILSKVSRLEKVL